MKAVSIDDNQVVEFHSERMLEALFDVEAVSPSLGTFPDGIDTIYVYINPFESEIYGRRVLCWCTDESKAKLEKHECGMDI
jgi:hypothetical protein